ncbi:hypothetical protein KKH39_00215 [Patescibacteria group bacterium]|nr:hypothetical protein [Patescibacteria group bacterium]
MNKIDKIAIVASWLLIIFFISASIVERLDTHNKDLMPSEMETITIVWTIIFVCLNIILRSHPNKENFQRSKKIILSIIHRSIAIFIAIFNLPFTEKDITGKTDIASLIKKFIIRIIIIIIPSIITIIYILFIAKNG